MYDLRPSQWVPRPSQKQSQAVSHSKFLFLVQTTHSAHYGTSFALKGATVQKIHKRS